MKRTRLQEKELGYNIYVGGRIYSAFRHHRIAEDLTYQLAREHPNREVELRENTNVGGEEACLLKFSAIEGESR